MAKQMGNRGRGPDDLDRAVQAQGQSVEDEGPPSDEDELYAGDVEEDTERLLAEGEVVGAWSEDDDDETLLAGDESVGPWSEDDELERGLSAGDDVDDDQRRGWGEEPGPRSGRR